MDDHEMDRHVKEALRLVTVGSDEERMSFPAVVGALIEAGVERYHADLTAATKTYYLPDGRFETLSCHPVPAAAVAFSAAGVEAAIRAIQAGQIQYRQFCAQIAAAGCAGYFVSIVGKRAIYYGRSGDMHVEWFPGAAPASAPTPGAA